MTTTTATPGRVLPAWFKLALLAALVFALCWGGAIAYWRSADSAPATSELVLMLLALPCGVLLAIGSFKRFALARPGAATTAANPASPVVAASPAPPPLAILAAALRSPHGASPEELAAAIAEGRARPDLDPELVDDDGFPVMSARSPDAVDEALQEELTDWLAVNGMAELRFGEAQWRALILGTAVARDLAAHAVSGIMSGEDPAPTLRLVPLLPPDWTRAQRSAAGAWFRHALSQSGWPDAAIVTLDLPHPSGQAELAAMLRSCATDSGAGDARLAAMVIACASHIDQETVDVWCAHGSLFTPTRQQGLVPGEGAAGLLLTGLDRARQADGAVFAHLHPLLEGRRKASLDEVKRAGSAALADLAGRVTQAAGLELSCVGAIAADTDQRANRALELMGLASSALPQLDDTLDVMRVGAALGACGCVPFVGALALAGHQALDAGAPALFISHGDPWSCCAALVCAPGSLPGRASLDG